MVCRRHAKLQQNELLQRLNEETLRQGQARDGNVSAAGRKVGFLVPSRMFGSPIPLIGNRLLPSTSLLGPWPSAAIALARARSSRLLRSQCATSLQTLKPRLPQVSEVHAYRSISEVSPHTRDLLIQVRPRES